MEKKLNISAFHITTLRYENTVKSISLCSAVRTVIVRRYTSISDHYFVESQRIVIALYGWVKTMQFK